MTLPVPSFVLDAIAHMEASARHHETTAGELRDAIATVRREFGVNTLASPPAASPPPPGANPTPVSAKSPKARPTGPAAGAPKPKAWKGEVSVDHEAREAIVLKAAKGLGPQFRMSQLCEAVPSLDASLLHLYITRLVASGVVNRTGVRAGTRYTAVVAANSEQPALVVDFTAVLLRALASGASYEVRELLKLVWPSAPSADEAVVEGVLAALVRDRKVERITTGAAPRFRKRAA